jgi:hypothetical protein
LRRTSDDVSTIAQLEFRHASNSFGGPAAASVDFAALQRGWRDFRMAP